MSFDDIIFIRLFKKRPYFYICVLIIYIGIFMLFRLYREKRYIETSISYKVESEIENLKEEIERQKNIINSLTISRKIPVVFRPINFKEDWEDSSKEAEINRIFEYANFAMSKDDYKRAKSLYEEAQVIQTTFLAQYYLGMLDYIEGDLNSCIKKWSTIVESAQDRFPNLRFHLAIVLYEAGESERSMKYLLEYIKIKEKK